MSSGRPDAYPQGMRLLPCLWTGLLLFCAAGPVRGQAPPAEWEEDARRRLKAAETPPDRAEEKPRGEPAGEDGASEAADPAAGRTIRDLLLAWEAGYRPLFAPLGLRVGRGPDGLSTVLGKDGRPASAEDLGRLGAAIRLAPRAVAAFPGFYGLVPPERLSELKSAYGAGAALRGGLFKDIGLSEERRDFLWERSCGRVSKDCNPYARSLSYEKGRYVSARDLRGLWRELQVSGSEPAFASALLPEGEALRDALSSAPPPPLLSGAGRASVGLFLWALAAGAWIALIAALALPPRDGKARRRVDLLKPEPR